jgi:Spy/CpxP family protein refolding chaperone
MTRVLILFIAVAVMAVGQTRDFFPWWDMPVSKNLNLTEEQTRQIHSTVREYRDRLVDLRATLEKAENQLGDLMNDDQPDQQKANGAIEKAVQARAELTRTFAQMGFKLRMVLTPQQWRQLQRSRPMPGQPGRPVMRPPGQPGPPDQPGQPGIPGQGPQGPAPVRTRPPFDDGPFQDRDPQ